MIWSNDRGWSIKGDVSGCLGSGVDSAAKDFKQ